MEFKVGDRVRIREDLKENEEYDGTWVDKEMLQYVGKIATIKWNSGGYYRIDLDDEEYAWVEEFFDIQHEVIALKNDSCEIPFEDKPKIKTQEQIKIEELEQRIEKLEKYASMGKYATDRKENVSNFEKMEQKTIEKRENEPIYERNERFSQILKEELEKKPNLEINLGKPNIDDKEFKQMLKNKPIVLNTNDPLEMIWNSTEEETKPSLLTEDERVILRNIDNGWKWIVRSKFGEHIFLYSEKPKKDGYGDWEGKAVYGFTVFDHLFKFIKYEDEPYNIEELLKGE